MSIPNKIYDFVGKMENNKTFYIFKSTSLADSSEILSKFRKFEKAPDFLEFYTNKKINDILKIFENIDSIFSDIYNEITSKKRKTKIEQYISSLSNLYLISNLISKNKIILEKAIDNTQKYMNNWFLENNIDKNIQKKISNYILNLLGLQSKKSKRISLLSLNNCKKFNKYKIERTNFCIINEKRNNSIQELKIIDHSINNSSLNQEKTRDITNNTYMNYKNIEDNIIIDFTTPKFQNKIIVEENLINTQQIINDKFGDTYSKKESINSIMNNENNEEINRKMDKKESIRSLYTLASKSKSNEESNKRDSKYKIINTDEKQRKNDLINILKSKSNNIKISSKFKVAENNLNNLEKKRSECQGTIKKDKKLILSSTNIETKTEKEMVKNLLVFINDLYRKEIIKSNEKLKLKQLIISKYETLENIYSTYYKKDKDRLIKEIKKLII